VPNTNLSKYVRGVYYIGINVFSNSKPAIKRLSHDTKAIKSAFSAHEVLK